MVTTRLNSSPEPTFLWQGLLLVLPVLILSGVGFFSLRQDRVLAQHEATQRAQSIAEDLLPRLWNELVKTSAPVQFGPYSFEIDSAGRLIFPPPIAMPPVPTPLHLERLSEEQVQLWERARQSEYDERDLAAAAEAYEAFLKSSPPPTFIAAALYSLGLALEKQGNSNDALKAFSSVIEDFPGAIGESGLALAPLAQ